MAGAEAIVMVNADEVAVSAVGAPESVTLKVRFVYVPAQGAVGAVPDVVVITPVDFRVKHAGNVVPFARVQV
jgi:hypothetical protein